MSQSNDSGPHTVPGETFPGAPPGGTNQPPAGYAPASGGGQSRRPRRRTVAIIAAVVAAILLLGGLLAFGPLHRFITSGNSRPAAAPADVTAVIAGDGVGINRLQVDASVSNRQIYRFVAKEARHGNTNLVVLIRWGDYEPTEGTFVNSAAGLRIAKEMGVWNHRHPAKPPEQFMAQLAFAPSWATADPSVGCSGSSICAPNDGHAPAYANAFGHLNSSVHTFRVPMLALVWYQPNILRWFPSDVGKTYRDMFTDTANKLGPTGTKVEVGTLAGTENDPTQGLLTPPNFVQTLLNSGLKKSEIDGVVLDWDPYVGHWAHTISDTLPGVPVSIVFQHTGGLHRMSHQAKLWRDAHGITKGSRIAWFNGGSRAMSYNASSVRGALNGR